MYARLGLAAAAAPNAWRGPEPPFAIHTASELLRASRLPLSSGTAVAEFAVAFPAQSASSQDEAAVDAALSDELALRSADEVEAFMELYGYWLGRGQLDASERGIAFHPLRAAECTFLRALLGRFSCLQQVGAEPAVCSSSNSAAAGCWTEAQREAGQEAFVARFVICFPRWWSAFSLKSEGGDDSEGGGLRFWRWLWRRGECAAAVVPVLSPRCARLALAGLVVASGGPALGSQLREGLVKTASDRFRDELLHVGLHAGFAVSFTRSEEAGTTPLWTVSLSAADSSLGRLPLSSAVTEEHWSGTVFCVSVPTVEQLIVVRRVTASSGSGSGLGSDSGCVSGSASGPQSGCVLSCSRPVVVGNTELNNNLGNFIQRILAFVRNSFGGVVPAYGSEAAWSADELQFMREVGQLKAAYVEQLEAVRIKEALKTAMELSSRANAFMQRTQPWELLKRSPLDCRKVVNVSVNLVYLLSLLLQPFMPAVSDSIGLQLNYVVRPGDLRQDVDAFKLVIAPGHVIGSPSPLFRKLEDREVVEYRARFGGVESRKQGADFPLHVVVGRVADCSDHPSKEHLYVLSIDCGPAAGGLRTVVAAVRAQYRDRTQLAGRLVAVLLNVKEATLHGVRSDALLLTAVKKAQALLVPQPGREAEVKVGSAVVPVDCLASSRERQVDWALERRRLPIETAEGGRVVFGGLTWRTEEGVDIVALDGKQGAKIQ